MRTQLTDALKATPEGREADAILRSCVHCGFCLATCPTYRLLGDELDSPRGRIYLIKQVLEGQPVTAKTRLHLDRCLTCRACETTCPSGVKYGRLVDIGRGLVEARTQRPPLDWAKRRALMAMLPRPGLFGALLGLGRRLQPWLPAALAAKVPPVAGVPPVTRVSPVASGLAGSAVTAKTSGGTGAAPASPRLVPPGARPSAVPGVASGPAPAGERPGTGLRSGPDGQAATSAEAGTRVAPRDEPPVTSEAGSRAANARLVVRSERTTALDSDPPAAATRPPAITDAVTSDAARPGDARRTLLVLEGCVQPALAPQINAAAARVLDRLGVSLLPVGGCCGALRFHLNAQEAGRDDMRRNVDAWHAHLEAGAAGIVSTASGCGVTVKDYGHLLALDPAYRARAERVAGATRDLSEVIAAEEPRLRALLATLPVPAAPRRVAFHAPCTLQHGQKLVGVVERLLTAAGFALTPVRDAYLCCGSAGTYALLQPDLAQRLLADKLDALQEPGPEVIATANIGCLSHLQGGASVPVRHWVELLDERLGGAPAGADGRV